jgi:hypothetical protein
MKLTIESTTEITEVQGCPCRMWEGKTEAGVRLWVFVALISASADAATAELDQELTQLLRTEGRFRPFDAIHDGRKP